MCLGDACFFLHYQQEQISMSTVPHPDSAMSPAPPATTPASKAPAASSSSPASAARQPKDGGSMTTLNVMLAQYLPLVMGIAMKSIKYLKRGALSFAFLLFAFLSLPTLKDPRVLELPEPPEMVGPAGPNKALSVGERLYEGVLHGPESFIMDGDHIYTTGMNGHVIDVYNGTIRNVARVGTGACGGPFEEPTCGRILGMRMDREGRIVFIDTYLGLYRVDKYTGKMETLYDSKTPINGQTATLLNDLDIGDDGKIYFTDSHDMYPRNQFIRALLEMRPCGRLLMYDPATGKTSVLVDGLLFPNGVQITKDGTGLLVVETIGFRIRRYDFKTKTLSMFAENLPGTIDNIRYSKETGTYWMGMSSPRSKAKPAPIDNMARNPGGRKTFMGRLMSPDIVTLMGHLHPKTTQYIYGLVSELDQNGRLVGAYRDPDGEVVEVASEVQVKDGHIYVSSVFSNFFAKVNVQKLRAAMPT